MKIKEGKDPPWRCVPGVFVPLIFSVDSSLRFFICSSPSRLPLCSPLLFCFPRSPLSIYTSSFRWNKPASPLFLSLVPSSALSFLAMSPSCVLHFLSFRRRWWMYSDTLAAAEKEPTTNNVPAISLPRFVLRHLFSVPASFDILGSRVAKHKFGHRLCLAKFRFHLSTFCVLAGEFEMFHRRLDDEKQWESYFEETCQGRENFSITNFQRGKNAFEW